LTFRVLFRWWDPNPFRLADSDPFKDKQIEVDQHELANTIARITGHKDRYEVLLVQPNLPECCE